MITGNTACCAVEEIDGLCDYVDRPREALLSIISSLMPDRSYDRWATYTPTMKTQIPAHLLFTGVEKVDELSEKDQDDEDDEYYDEDPDNIPIGYAEQFYKYLQENKLGTVVRTSAQYNRVNHPNHKVRAYLWTPDLKALEAWYSKNKKKRSDF